MNVETIILDNIKYIILNKLNVNGNEYLYVIDSREDNDNISIFKNSFIPVILLIIFKLIPIAPSIALEYAYDIYFFL